VKLHVVELEIEKRALAGLKDWLDRAGVDIARQRCVGGELRRSSLEAVWRLRTTPLRIRHPSHERGTGALFFSG